MTTTSKPKAQPAKIQSYTPPPPTIEEWYFEIEGATSAEKKGCRPGPIPQSQARYCCEYEYARAQPGDQIIKLAGTMLQYKGNEYWCNWIARSLGIWALFSDYFPEKAWQQIPNHVRELRIREYENNLNSSPMSMVKPYEAATMEGPFAVLKLVFLRHYAGRLSEMIKAAEQKLSEKRHQAAMRASGGKKLTLEDIISQPPVPEPIETFWLEIDWRRTRTQIMRDLEAQILRRQQVVKKFIQPARTNGHHGEWLKRLGALRLVEHFCQVVPKRGSHGAQAQAIHKAREHVFQVVGADYLYAANDSLWVREINRARKEIKQCLAAREQAASGVYLSMRDGKGEVVSFPFKT